MVLNTFILQKFYFAITVLTHFLSIIFKENFCPSKNAATFFRVIATLRSKGIVWKNVSHVFIFWRHRVTMSPTFIFWARLCVKLFSTMSSTNSITLKTSFKKLRSWFARLTELYHFLQVLLNCQIEFSYCNKDVVDVRTWGF